MPWGLTGFALCKGPWQTRSPHPSKAEGFAALLENAGHGSPRRPPLSTPCACQAAALASPFPGCWAGHGAPQDTVTQLRSSAVNQEQGYWGIPASEQPWEVATAVRELWVGRGAGVIRSYTSEHPGPLSVGPEAPGPVW